MILKIVSLIKHNNKTSNQIKKTIRCIQQIHQLIEFITIKIQYKIITK
jgi:hypothetical protein